MSVCLPLQTICVSNFIYYTFDYVYICISMANIYVTKGYEINVKIAEAAFIVANDFII